ncbi:hypothetical protein PsorP6_014191 [Peronosclerospora sorghi]|uniref:Uncharacterized protein n=1 Tax=Peronosclerospora sorghi TaxID=230839 RepID=A0ACC0VH01_9STRA|nr:hypothetical protein PsorP6_014191 [Peronosclerospora sorghi]
MLYHDLAVAIVTCTFLLLDVTSAVSKLPVIYFHGVFGTPQDGKNFVSNLTAEGRIVESLSFCDGPCSIQSLLTQVPMAVKAVRKLVASNAAFNDGYIVVGHSQGGLLSRAVIEEMDDHKVKRYISLAGLQNGQFIGPERVDKSIADGGTFLKMLVPETTYNYSGYRPGDYYGKLQREFALYMIENPHAQYTYSQFSVNRWPHFCSFSRANFFLPVYNNVNHCPCGDDSCELEKKCGDHSCELEKKRRKENFLRVEQAHFFASPADDVIMPWTSSIFGRYSEVHKIEEIETQFKKLTFVEMKDTLEYTADTFGLQTLDKRGGLFLHTVENVNHMCWIMDAYGCKWSTVNDKYLYPILV